MKTIPVPVLFLLLSIMGVVSLSPDDSCAESIKRRLIVATSASMSPMEMIDQDGTIAGFDIDIIRAVAKEADFHVEIINHAWKDLFPGLEQGTFDAVISTVTITEKRRERFDFSVPYVTIGQVLVIPSEMNNAQGLAGMEGMKVGAVEGSLGAYEVKRSSGIQLKDYDEIGHAFQDMATGRIQGVVCDYITAADLISGNDIYMERFRIAGPPFTRQECGIAVRKGNTGVLDMINRGVLAIQSKGIAEQLETRWFKPPPASDSDKELYLPEQR